MLFHSNIIQKQHSKIRTTIKIIIIDNLIILIYNIKFDLSIYNLMFFILINIHIYRHLSIYYQLIVLLIISNQHYRPTIVSYNIGPLYKVSIYLLPLGA